MLGLFQEEHVLGDDEALARSRAIFQASLNKGRIPNWDSFANELPAFSSPQLFRRVEEKFQNLIHWPFLADLLEGASELFLHSPKGSLRLMASGKREAVALPIDEEDWQTWLEVIAIHYGQNWNVQKPFVSFHGEVLGKHFRFSLIHGSTSPCSRSKLVMRSLAPRPFALSDYLEGDLLGPLVETKKNILIAGSTGSGKTSLLTALLAGIHPEEHLVILEDTFEILTSHPYQTRLLSGDDDQRSLKAYLTYALRLSPDRIVLGEMRSHEIVPFLLAMNTGHRGLMGTIHASSAVDSLNRMALLFSIYGSGDLTQEKVMELICRNLEYVIFMEHKKVTEVIRIFGSDRGFPVFERILGQSQKIQGL